MAVDTEETAPLKIEQMDDFSDSDENINVTDEVEEQMETDSSRDLSGDIRAPSPEEGDGPSPAASPNLHLEAVQHDNGALIPNVNHHQQAPQEQDIRVTNFLIEDILKPEFGVKNTKPGRTNGCTWRPFEDVKPSAAFKSQDRDISLSLHSLHRVGYSRNFHRHHQGPSHLSPSYEIDHRRRCNSTASVSSSDSSPLSSPKSKRPASKHPDLEGIAKNKSSSSGRQSPSPEQLWPAWVYCTRYSDRPSSGPRSRKMEKKPRKQEEKRPRTAFSNEQLGRLKQEFDDNRYLTEERRHKLAKELDLNESQIKIWFQNKRAKAKKATGVRNVLALQLMAQGLYNHSTVAVRSDDEDEDEKKLL